jgi:hypothetical protein
LRAEGYWFKLDYFERTKLKINVSMSEKVGTRTSHQCHSHHQKMIMKFGSLAKLLEFATTRKKKISDVHSDDEWKLKRRHRSRNQQKNEPFNR